MHACSFFLFTEICCPVINIMRFCMFKNVLSMVYYLFLLLLPCNEFSSLLDLRLVTKALLFFQKMFVFMTGNT